MTLRTTQLLFYLFLALTLPAGAEEADRPLQGTVSWVYDGDTLKIEPHGKVRLIGIDTPEREASERDRYLARQGVSPRQQRKIYERAKQFNIKNVKGKAVSLTFDHTTRDRHGRLLAYVYLADGRLLNQILLKQGLAVVYRRFDFLMKDAFLKAEATAHAQQIGLWATSP